MGFFFRLHFAKYLLGLPDYFCKLKREASSSRFTFSPLGLFSKFYYMFFIVWLSFLCLFFMFIVFIFMSMFIVFTVCFIVFYCIIFTVCFLCFLYVFIVCFLFYCLFFYFYYHHNWLYISNSNRVVVNVMMFVFRLRRWPRRLISLEGGVCAEMADRFRPIFA